jgi:hypothetical protein
MRPLTQYDESEKSAVYCDKGLCYDHFNIGVFFSLGADFFGGYCTSNLALD